MVAARTNSKGDICVSLCQLLVSAGGAGPSQTPSIAKRRRRLRAGTSVLIGEGPLRISEKYSRGRWQQRHKDNTQVVSFHYKGTYRPCQWLLESLDLGSLCLVDLWREKHRVRQVQSRLDYNAPNSVP